MIAAARPLAPPMTPLGYVGRVFRNTRASGFKLALVVGALTPTTNRIQVRFWRANSGQWTQPTWLDLLYMQELTLAERKKHRRTIDAALGAARALGFSFGVRP